MKATTDAAGLHSLADWCARIAPARPAVPILGAVLLETGDDGLRATVTDYDQFGRADMDAVVDTDERLAVSARLLAGVAEAVASAGNGRVELVADGDGKLRVSSRGLKASLPLMHAEDYPAWPAQQVEHLRAINGAALAKVLDDAGDIASTDRESIAKVRLESDPDRLRVVATDSYRLHIIDLPWLEPADFRYHGVIYLSPSGARMVAGAVKGAERVLIGLPGEGHNSLTVGTPHRTMLTRLADGSDYPTRWEQLAPTTGRTVTLDRTDLLALVKRVSTLAAVQGDKSRHVNLDVSAGTLTLTASGDDASLSDDLGVEHSPDWDEGEPVMLVVNSAFLADAAASVPAKRLTLLAPGPAKPVLISPADGETPDYPARAVVMAIRNK